MTDHKNHRQRLRERYLKEGLDNFNDINALELLLFYCIPRRDTNPVAHELIDNFGDLAGVMDAKPEELAKIPGIGKNAATFLSLIRDMGRYYLVRQTKPGQILRTTEACGKFLQSHFLSREVETVFLLCLDAKCKVISCRKVGEGSVNSANVPVRRIVEMALSANATTAILAHNHPGGLAIPSADDVQTTAHVAKALELVDIVLADHFVVSNDDYVSMVQSGYYQPPML